MRKRAASRQPVPEAPTQAPSAPEEPASKPLATASTARMGWIELVALVAAAGGSLLFNSTLPARLPRAADWQQAAEAVRAGFEEGDAVAVAPEWAERARQVIHGYPFVAVPDLTHTDLSRVRRLWLVGLPDAPRSDLAKVQAFLASSLEPRGPVRRFGELTVALFDNPGFVEPKFDFTSEIGRARVSIELPGQRIECPRDGEAHHCPRAGTVARETRELEFAPYDCVGADPVGRFPLVVDYPDATLGSKLEVLLGVTGEMGWRTGEGRTPVRFNVAIDGQPSGELVIPPGTVPPQRMTIDTRDVDLSRPHEVRFAVSSDNPRDREFCFDARAY